MIIRHAEKPTAANGEHGVAPDGEHDKHSLTVRGWTRAGALVGLFTAWNGGPASGLACPATIYASGRDSDGSRRSMQTVAPLAQRLGVDVHHGFGVGDEDELAARLAADHAGPTLVAWHHEAIPRIVRRLGATEPPAPPEWADDRFDVVWTLAQHGTGWRFAQVPQLLLDGDRPEPIGDPSPECSPPGA